MFSILPDTREHLYCYRSCPVVVARTNVSHDPEIALILVDRTTPT